MKLKKIFFLLTIFFLLFACQKNNKQINKNDIKLALSVFIDSTIMVAQSDKNEKFVIYPEFIDDYNIEKIQEMENDTIFSKNDINFMLKQYNILKKSKIKKYSDEKYFSIIKDEKPYVGQRTYYVSPPLFSLNEKYFVIYARMFFMYKNKIKWDDLSFLYKKRKNGYVLIGYLKWFD